MKKYETPEIELCVSMDVITTSSEVTTGGINVPWGSSASNSSYELFYELCNESNYEL